MIVIVDYGMGNLRSVQKAFEHGGARAQISPRPDAVRKAAKIVLPGVGAFAAAMRELEKRKLTEALKEKIASGTPTLGLCLGLQLLFDESEEAGRGTEAKGLGLIRGRVRRFKGNMKIPHMGWNTVEIKKRNCPLLRGIESGDYFYFVHSYYAVPEDASWGLTKTRYGTDFCSSVWKENIFATQFHPEKSQVQGLRLIKNFIKL